MRKIKIINNKLNPLLTPTNPYYPLLTPKRGYKNGFTFIEIIITLTIMAIVFVPLMRMLSASVEEAERNRAFLTAANLAASEMESLKSRNLTERQIALEGNVITRGIKMNGSLWRVERRVLPGTDPLQVEVDIYRKTEPDRPMLTLVTLIEDLW